MNAVQEPIASPHGSTSPLRRHRCHRGTSGPASRWQIEDSPLLKSYHFDTARLRRRVRPQRGRKRKASNHHPHVHWWKRDVRIELYTHKSNGLTIRDFEFAARCDALSKEPA